MRQNIWNSLDKVLDMAETMHVRELTTKAECGYIVAAISIALLIDSYHECINEAILRTCHGRFLNRSQPVNLLLTRTAKAEADFQYRLRQAQQLSDFSIICDKTEYKAHKLILAAQSDYFRALCKDAGWVRFHTKKLHMLNRTEWWECYVK